MRVEAGLSNQYTAAAMVLVICGRVVSVSTRAELTNVHSVPSATGSCAEDGDLVAGAIGGARHRTDQWIEPGMRVHYTGSFCARPVKRTAI